MNRNFYIFSILFLGLMIISGLWQTIIRFQIGPQIFGNPSFSTWFLGTSLISMVASIFILKYFHHKKYVFAFSSGIFAVIANLLLAIIVYVILSHKSLESFYLPAFTFFLATGIIFSLCLIFSPTGKRPWLKAVGIFNLIIGSVLATVFAMSRLMQNIPYDTMEKISQWASLAGSLVPILYILNFMDELKKQDLQKNSRAMKGPLSTILGIAVTIALIFILASGSMLTFQDNISNIRSCDFTVALERERTNRNYDSLLALKDIPNIERKLSAPNPSREAEALYRYLLDIYGKRTLSGQAWASWGYGELNYIQEKTGKQPAIRNMDFIHQRENEAEVKHAIEWWNSGGIPTIMWHWGGPGKGEGYENSKKAVDIEKCFIEGTDEYEAFWSELENKADLLEKIRDAHVPVLWRPYHELNGHWFWWGKQGPEKFKKLWVTMYDYFVHERKLNNLIWVLCYTGNPEGSWFPGDKYVDIVGSDTYDGCEEPHVDMYTKAKEIVQDNPMPIAYHECGVPPDPDLCLDEDVMWLWWMEWHTDHLKKIDVDYLNLLYHHELIVTKDEVPDIMGMYGK